jgi:hypothetical protein
VHWHHSAAARVVRIASLGLTIREKLHPSAQVQRLHGKHERRCSGFVPASDLPDSDAAAVCCDPRQAAACKAQHAAGAPCNAHHTHPISVLRQAHLHFFCVCFTALAHPITSASNDKLHASLHACQHVGCSRASAGAKQAARCAAEQPQPQQQQAQRSRREALAMGAAAGIVLPGMLRPGDAAAAAAPVSDQLMAQQLCRASAFDARGGLGAVGNPVAEVAEGGIAARSNDRIELGKSGGIITERLNDSSARPPGSLQQSSRGVDNPAFKQGAAFAQQSTLILPSLQVWRSRPSVLAPGHGATAQVTFCGRHEVPCVCNAQHLGA